MDQILKSIKIRLSIADDSEDDYLTDILNSAFIAICDKLFGVYETIDSLPAKFKEVAKNAVVIAYNQQGAEGQRSVSSDSISQSFLNSDMYEYIQKVMPNKPVV